MRTILFLDSVHPKVDQALLDAGFATVHDYTSNYEAILKLVSKVEGVIIRSRFKLDQSFFNHASQLKFVLRYGAGLENIDVTYAESKNVKCLRVPEGNRDAVGEQALGMLLMLMNNLKRADNEIRNGVWKREENRGYEVHGKIVGIIGYGYMGSGFAEKLQGFGCSIIAYDKYKKNYAPTYVEEVGLKDIFKRADIVSIHVPLTEETDHWIDEEFFAQFDKSIYFINTARGPITDTQAVLNGIKCNKILGACLDVLEFEKTSFENLFERNELPQALKELIKNEKVVLSPHVAGWSFESYEKLANASIEKILRLYN